MRHLNYLYKANWLYWSNQMRIQRQPVAVALYGDYDEATKIGAAPENLACTIAGQSPDGKWVYLECPAPTNNVWAKVGDLGLSAEARSALLDTRVISRSVPTVPASFPSA